MNTLFLRIKNSITRCIKPAIKTALWICKITISVSFLVYLIKICNLLPKIAKIFAPIFKFMGISGDGALVYISAFLVNIYACIGVIATLNLSNREITILALMCLIAHNIPVESAVQKKTGTSFISITLVRVFMSFVGGYLLHIILPKNISHLTLRATSKIINQDILTSFIQWIQDASYLTIKIIILVVILMIIQSLMEEFNITFYIAKILKYPLKIMGIPEQASFLWIVANTLGLAYGAGILIHNVHEKKSIKRMLIS